MSATDDDYKHDEEDYDGGGGGDDDGLGAKLRKFGPTYVLSSPQPKPPEEQHVTKQCDNTMHVSQSVICSSYSLLLPFRPLFIPSFQRIKVSTPAFSS